MTASEPLFLNQPSWLVRIICLVTAVITGGLTGRWWVTGLTGRYGGQPVPLTAFGESFFSVIGAVGGFSAAITILAIFRVYRQPWQVSLMALVLSAVAGCIAAPPTIVALSVMFFTIPRELFELLFDLSTVERQ
jgi:hypothetical protein